LDSPLVCHAVSCDHLLLLCLPCPPLLSSLVPYSTLFRSLRGRTHRRPPSGLGHEPHRGDPQRATLHLEPGADDRLGDLGVELRGDRKSTRLNSSHVSSSYAVFCLKTKTSAV